MIQDGKARRLRSEFRQPAEWVTASTEFNAFRLLRQLTRTILLIH
jgi:hypothetical protein